MRKLQGLILKANYFGKFRFEGENHENNEQIIWFIQFTSVGSFRVLILNKFGAYENISGTKYK